MSVLWPVAGEPARVGVAEGVATDGFGSAVCTATGDGVAIGADEQPARAMAQVMASHASAWLSKLGRAARAIWAPPTRR